MALRLDVAVLALVVATAAAVALLPAPAAAGAAVLDAMVAAASSSGRRRMASTSCDGAIGECDVDDEADDVEELALVGAGPSAGAEALQRSLAARRPTNRYVSYASLDANNVPCNKRGQSYYQNCASQKAANPYRRGCSAITRCARTMN